MPSRDHMLGYPQILDAIDPLPVRKPAPPPVRGPVWWVESDHIRWSDGQTCKGVENGPARRWISTVNVVKQHDALVVLRDGLWRRADHAAWLYTQWAALVSK